MSNKGHGVTSTKKDLATFLVTVTTMSSESRWKTKDLTLKEAVTDSTNTINNNNKNLKIQLQSNDTNNSINKPHLDKNDTTITSITNTTNTHNHNHTINSTIDYSYDIDYNYSQLHTPSNINDTHGISGSYGSISIPSNLNTPTATTSHHHTPQTNMSIQSHLTYKDINTNSKYQVSTPISHEPSNSISYSKSKSNSFSRSKSRRKLKNNKSNIDLSNPAHKFAQEFYKKAKVKSVMRGNTMIGQFEAKLMLAYFRNVEPENIESSG